MKTTKTICATLVLDNSGTELISRISNKVYSMCRSGDLQLASFPDFEPTMSALRDGSSAAPTRNYKVCLQHHDRLLVLESFAEKWTTTALTSERAEQVIELHNTKYNPNGDYWLCDKSLAPDELVWFEAYSI